MPNEWTVIKQDAAGHEILRYPAVLLHHTGNTYVFLAEFTHGPVEVCEVKLEKGDVFTEYFYLKRWFNIFCIHDRHARILKGWYVNFTRPALVSDQTILAEDLALDLFVFPDFSWEILDQHEFDQLALSHLEKQAVAAALKQVQQMITARVTPFQD